MFKKKKKSKNKGGCGRLISKKKLGLSQSEFDSLINSMTINDNFRGVVKTVIRNDKRKN